MEKFTAATTPARGPAPDDTVWVSTARKGIEAHAVPGGDAALTPCGRNLRYGLTVTAAEATEQWGSQWCQRCWPEVDAAAAEEFPVKTCKPPRLDPEAPEITCTLEVELGSDSCWQHQPCTAPSLYRDGDMPCESFTYLLGSKLCEEHGNMRWCAVQVNQTRAELQQALADAAKALREAQAAGRKLGEIDHDHTSADDLDRAIGQALTGVHAGTHLTPEPEQLPEWMGRSDSL